MLNPGQFIFGRHTAAEVLQMKPSTVRDRMALLEKNGNIDRQTATHCSIITIRNWGQYQHLPNKTTTGKPTPNRHKEEYIYSNEYFSVSKSQYEKYQKAYPKVKIIDEFNRMDSWLDSNPKKRKKNYPRFINSWLSRESKKIEDSNQYSLDDEFEQL